tara:strand:- start:4 stop:222 length:219 start_codon:yes stop_codon:yes gene_type:complete
MTLKKPDKQCYNDITHKIKTIESKLAQMRLKIEEIKNSLTRNRNFKEATEIESVHSDLSDLLMYTNQGDLDE